MLIGVSFIILFLLVMWLFGSPKDKKPRDPRHKRRK